MNALDPELEAKLRERLETSRQEYASRLPDMASRLNQDWQELESGGWSRSKFLEFYHQVHSLGGSAGTFGFAPYGERVRKLETLLCDCGLAPGRDVNAPPDEATCAVIRQQVTGLLDLDEEPPEHS